MKRRPLYCIIILFIISLTIIVNTGNANAYTFFSNFNITKFSYKPDSTNNTVIDINSINSYSSTPIVSDAFSGNYHAILAPKFTLNKDANLSKTQRLLLKFEINLRIDENTSNTTTYPNMFFICPYGYDQLRVANCSVTSSDLEAIPFQNVSGSQYALENHKSYIIELELYHNSDTAQAYRELQLAGRIFSVSVNTSSSTYLNAFSWQITWVQSSGFYYENPNGAAEALEEQNRKDEQDRSNMNNQQGDIDDSADESTEDMDNATSNITGIVTTFLGNLNNLNRNNCTLPNISAYGFSLGELNLCTFQPPQWVRTVTSAVVSLIVLSMAVHVFRRIMRIAKGIAGSK